MALRALIRKGLIASACACTLLAGCGSDSGGSGGAGGGGGAGGKTTGSGGRGGLGGGTVPMAGQSGTAGAAGTAGMGEVGGSAGGSTEGPGGAAGGSAGSAGGVGGGATGGAGATGGGAGGRGGSGGNGGTAGMGNGGRGGGAGGRGGNGGTGVAGMGGAGAGGAGGAPVVCATKTLTGNVTATANADLNQLADVTDLSGSLSIGGTITNLAPLNCLTRVTGNVTINGASNLTAITFSRLTTVGGRVVVQSDPMLTTVGLPVLVSVGSGANLSLVFDTLPKLNSVDVHSLVETPLSSGISFNQVGSTATGNLALSFTALTTVRGALNFANVANLTNLDTFTALRTVGGRLTINNDAALLQTTGLAGVRTVGSDVAIQSNPALTSIDLRAVTSVGSTNNQSLVFDALPKVTSLDMRALTETDAGAGATISQVGTTAAATLTLNFAALATVRNTFTINAVNLVNLDGLAALRTVNGRLVITNNAALLNTTGLGGLRTVSNDVMIQMNAALTTVDLHSLTSVGATGTQSLLFDALPKLTALDVRGVVETPTGGGVALTTLGATASGALAANFAALTTVRGALNISSVPNLGTLDGFAALRTVNGRLVVTGNATLANTTGLNGVRTVGSDVVIQNDAALTAIDLRALISVGAANNQSLTFDALPKVTSIDVRNLAETPAGGGIALTTVGTTASGLLALNFTALATVRGTLNITAAANLDTLNAFAALRTVGGRLVVANNPVLANAAGLSGVMQVANDVSITGDGVLTTIDLRSLTSVGATGAQSLVLDTLPKLTSLDVRALAQTAASAGISITTVGATAAANLTLNFAALTNVRGGLTISAAANLLNLGAFAALTTVTGALTISGNATLTDVATGLSLLTRVGGNYVVTNNVMLCQTTVLALRDAIVAANGIGGTPTTTGNKADC